MFDLENYINRLISLLKEHFDKRLLYVGLQGSYLRGEATDNSDIDVMLVIDKLSVADLDAYRDILKAAGNYEKSCGFICGREDLAKWNPLEICHLLHTTKDIYGTLSQLTPAYTREDEINFIKLSLNNLYHELCHRYIHATRDRNIAALPQTYKSVFFILQNLQYLRSGVFVPTKRKLLETLEGEDKAVMEMLLKFNYDTKYDFDTAFALLFDWCKKKMAEI